MQADYHHRGNRHCPHYNLFVKSMGVVTGEWLSAFTTVTRAQLSPYHILILVPLHILSPLASIFPSPTAKAGTKEQQIKARAKHIAINLFFMETPFLKRKCTAFTMHFCLFYLIWFYNKS